MKYLLFRLCLVLLLLHLRHEVNGQSAAWTQYYTGNSPLPFNSVRCITFESDSIAWIGTDFGLAKFSNGNWTVYNTGNSGISSNSILTVAIDGNNRKWIGTMGAGVNVYNDTNWVNYLTSNSPLPDDIVRSMAVDTLGSVWMGTLGGLAKLDSTGNWSVFTMWNSVLGANNIACIYVDTLTDDKWVGTVNGGVLLIEKDTNLTKFVTQNSGISDNTILGIDMDNMGNVYMASPANGLIVKLSGFGWLTYNLLSSNIPTAGLSSLVLDSLQKPWIGSIDHGLLYKNGSNFVYYDTSNSPLTDVNIQCVNRDATGKIWMGTQTGGLFILDPSLLTSLGEPAASSTFHVYPNPASDLLWYSGPQQPASAEITDPGGRSLLAEQPMNGPIRVSSLAPGLYQVRYRFAGGDEKVFRFIRN